MSTPSSPPPTATKRPRARRFASETAPSPARVEERVWRESGLDGAALLRAAYQRQSFARHVHDTFVIGVDTGGLSSTWYRGAERVVPRGHLLLLAPDEVQTGTQLSAAPWRCRAFYPGPGLLERAYGEVTGRRQAVPSFPCPTVDDPQLVAAFLSAHRTLEVDLDRLVGEACMLQFLVALLLRHAAPSPCPAPVPREPDRIGRVIEFVQAHLADESLSLDRMAAHAGLGRFHFLRVFARTVGMTPHVYLTLARVERAKERIRRGDDLADTALACGFADQSHLTRRFKSVVGVTPGEFRRGCSASRSAA